MRRIYLVCLSDFTCVTDDITMIEPRGVTSIRGWVDMAIIMANHQGTVHLGIYSDNPIYEFQIAIAEGRLKPDEVVLYDWLDYKSDREHPLLFEEDGSIEHWPKVFADYGENVMGRLFRAQRALRDKKIRTRAKKAEAEVERLRKLSCNCGCGNCPCCRVKENAAAPRRGKGR